MPEAALTILTYHAVDARDSVISVAPERFRRDAERLADRGLAGVSLQQAFEYRDRHGGFPPNAVVLTFDDGYLSVYRHAAPVLRALGFGATVFVTSGCVGLDGAAARRVNADLDRDMMDWRQLEELAGQGLEIGGHARSHPDLARLDAARLEDEVGGCRRDLERALQVPVRSFAYPYGHVDGTVREAAARHYDRACTTALGHNGPGADPLMLKRLDAFFLGRGAVFDRACSGALAAWWPLHQALRDARARLRRRR